MTHPNLHSCTPSRECQRWYHHAVRQAELLGAIRAWADTLLDPNRPISPAHALGRIRRLLADYDNENPDTTNTGGGGDRS